MAARAGGATLVAGGQPSAHARTDRPGRFRGRLRRLLALVVDMVLGWVTVTVYSAGLFDTPLTFDMRVTGSGWAGWGVVGGVLAIVLVLWHARSLRRGEASIRAAAITAALAAATAGRVVGLPATLGVPTGGRGAFRFARFRAGEMTPGED